MKEHFIEKTITQCRALFCIHEAVIIDYKLESCSDSWGCSSQVSDTHYMIRINPTMSIRDTVATTIHEMIHVKQWISPSHAQDDSDGEEEAENYQYKLTDILWGLGLL